MIFTAYYLTKIPKPSKSGCRFHLAFLLAHAFQAWEIRTPYLFCRLNILGSFMVDTRFVFLELGSLNMWAPLVFFTPNSSRTIIGLPTISLLLWPIAWQGKAGESNPMTTRENAANRQPTLSSTPHVSRTNAIAHHKALQCTYAFLIGCGGILIKINFGWRTLLMMSLQSIECYRRFEKRTKRPRWPITEHSFWQVLHTESPDFLSKKNDGITPLKILLKLITETR